ncbi:MAG TPA: hypothetical protein IAC14_12995 [Candidatus Scybalomonas excrementigallinarum]|nr:hypothetical protein [Candidatus Scybalomonas excrementigallinarum]
MRRFKKNFVISAIALTMFLGTPILNSTAVKAADISGLEVAEQMNIGVSFEDEIQRSVARPTEVWNIATKGQYDFAGSANYQALYTNYKFKGKTSYKVYIKNTGNSAITVKAKRLTKTYATTKISAGKTGSFEFSNIQSDTEFYIVFESNDSYSFEGYIK